MNHFASPDFWELFNRLPTEIQALAKANFTLLKADPKHPSLHFKKVDGYWSARVGIHYRVLGKEVEEGVLWGWIGSHSEYERHFALTYSTVDDATHRVAITNLRVPYIRIHRPDRFRKVGVTRDCQRSNDLKSAVCWPSAAVIPRNAKYTDQDASARA